MNLGKKGIKMRKYILSVGKIMEVYIEDAPRERIKYCVRINVNGHDFFAKGNSLKEAYRECTNKARKMVKMDARKEAE